MHSIYSPVATKRSDKYLLQQTNNDRSGSSSKHKKSKKSASIKKGKKSSSSKHQIDDDDDDDSGAEPQPLHQVSTFIEMPEGASLSDNDDANLADANDPHRALDIDLDM